MRKVAIAALAVLALGIVAVPAIASHPEASLPGSNFEIDVNANLKVDDPAPSIDWASVAETRRNDTATGQNDNSYSGGAKEDDTCPATTTGSIPNNKSDLLTFGAYVEPEVGGPGFLNLFWTRVQEPSGTTLMDFELNQSSTDCGNGVNPVRTVDDLLIEYRIEQGGAVATIKVRTWTGSAWGPAVDLTAAALAAGTINTTPIPAAESDGLSATNPLSTRTFGEAQLDLDFVFDEGKCESFGSAFLKSRASDAFTSQLKDFIAPVPVNITNCGKVIIRKQTNPDEDPNTTDFGYTKSFGTDPSTANTFTLKDDGVQTFNNVLFGTGYTVVEDVIPANWAFVSLDCSASTGVTPSINSATVTFAIDNAADILDCTYTNQLQVGALRILKNSTKGGAVSQPGAVFSYDGQSVTDNGTGDEDADVGEVCVSGLALGDYTVNETSPPPGYGDASQEDLTVTVVAGTNCTDNQPTGTGVATFTNAPLADIQVNFRDGGSGETSATSITCDNAGTTPDTTPATGWDDSVTHEDIPIDPSPRTIVCTIEIDP
jgi:Prealbumin-like fold domain